MLATDSFSNLKPLKFIIALFFIAYLLLGLAIHDDFGVAWDEGAWRALGVATVRYVVDGNPDLLTNQDRYNGPVFQVLLVAVERLFNLTEDSRAVFLMRHLVNFLLFYIGVIFFYHLCKRNFGSRVMGLLGASFLVLSPRIFAQSFYNSSDIALLVMFIISFYTLVSFGRKPSIRMAILHGLASALTVNIRTMGVLVPALTLLWLGWIFLCSDKPQKAKTLASSVVYLVALFSLSLLFWPALWSNPLVQLQEALGYMRDVPWGNSVLYRGQMTRSTDLPWHYIPVWIVITTPLFYVANFFVGCSILILTFLTRTRIFLNEQGQNILFLLWFILPVGAVCLLRPGLYDAWRHLFFVYPAFLMISLRGIHFIYQILRPGLKNLFVVVILLSMLHTSWEMAGLHPYQNVYFNRLAGRDMKAVKQKYELDYWGLSYRQALEYILDHDSQKLIKVHAANQPGIENAKILTSKQRKRLLFVDDINEAKYFLSNFRWHKEDYPYEDEYYSIKRGNAIIMAVYRL
jgi:hypothetical protein